MSMDQTTPPRNGIPPWRRLLIDEEELSDMLGVSKPTARRYVSEGYLRPVEMPLGIRRKLYRRADVEAFVETLALEASHAVAG